LFFARHLDYFIMTQNSQTLPGLGTFKTNYRDPELFSHLPGLAKNNAPRRRRHLIKPPGRYKQSIEPPSSLHALRADTLEACFLLGTETISS
jgi:hypothetical protein